MTKRFGSLAAVAGILATASVFALPGAAYADGSLPTLTVALNGITGVSVSGSMVSGAVSINATFTGKAPPGGPNSNGPSFGIVRLKPGVTIQQAAGAVNAAGGDLNALTAYASLFVSASAPATVQTVLTPGSYVALNDTGNGQPGFAPFTVAQSSAPAVLPAAASSQTAIEFAFRGPPCCTTGRWCGRRTTGTSCT